MFNSMTPQPTNSVTASASAITTHTGGGAVIDGTVTAGGDVIGRDQINITIHQTVLTIAPSLPPNDLHLLNFGKPLSEQQRNQIEQALGFRISRVIAKQVEFNEEADFGPKVVALLDSIGFTPHEWQTIPLLVNPPGFAPVEACLLSELHGRMGHFPTVIRSRPAPEPGGKESILMNVNPRPAANSALASGWGHRDSTLGRDQRQAGCAHGADWRVKRAKLAQPVYSHQPFP